jgi:hypothetical protein
VVEHEARQREDAGGQRTSSSHSKAGANAPKYDETLRALVVRVSSGRSSISDAVP